MDISVRMLNLLALVVCLYVGASSSTNAVGYCGGIVSIRCEYESRYGSRPKYFCRGEQGDCTELIRTSTKNKWFTKGRYSLLDDGTHYFVVSISGLAVTDTGRYQCGVSVRGEEAPVQSEVNLEVKDDLFTCGRTLMKTAYTGDAVNVTCRYLDAHLHAAKYLCKAFRNQGCDSRVSAREDRTWVRGGRISVYDDRKARVFTAVLGALGTLDRGNYWCAVETGWEHGGEDGGEDGYKALIQRVQLTVSGLTTNPVKLLTTSTNPSAIEAEDTRPTSVITPQPTTPLDTTETTVRSSFMPDQVWFSTPVPIIESSSGLWRIIIYGIAALFVLVILSSLLLLVITRSKRAKAADVPPYLVSMDALWESPLMANDLEYHTSPLESDPPEPTPTETNSFQPTANEPDPSQPSQIHFNQVHQDQNLLN
ncbi:CMRF35-like molecule 8 isoform X2 [Alosa alosa]|uniref:CMRF35-like molecule 8 isoform X2 n=1 Tax=Alosa alosa TaxID=278164 RepID=UPI00201548E0|nr:CMRF35-like molecule 8 isoform X2 [Alosa alosa]